MTQQKKPGLLDAFLRGLAMSGKKQKTTTRKPVAKKKPRTGFTFTAPGCGKC